MECRYANMIKRCRYFLAQALAARQAIDWHSKASWRYWSALMKLLHMLLHTQAIVNIHMMRFFFFVYFIAPLYCLSAGYKALPPLVAKIRRYSLWHYRIDRRLSHGFHYYFNIVTGGHVKCAFAIPKITPGCIIFEDYSRASSASCLLALSSSSNDSFLDAFIFWFHARQDGTRKYINILTLDRWIPPAIAPDIHEASDYIYFSLQPLRHIHVTHANTDTLSTQCNWRDEECITTHDLGKIGFSYLISFSIWLWLARHEAIEGK